jgi:hypothetical protein
MTIGQQLEDMSIGLNVSANLTDLLGPDGKRLEGETGDVLTRAVENSGKAMRDLVDEIDPSDWTSAIVDYTVGLRENANRASEDFRASGLPGAEQVDDVVTGLKKFLIDTAENVLTLGDTDKTLDASQLGLVVSSTMSTIEGGRQALATFELIYDEKEATVQKEIEHARAIKDTAAEVKAIEKLEILQTKRAEERSTLQKAFAKQLQATQDIYTRTTSQGRSDILGGFMDQFTNLYKDTPMAAVATAIKEDLERLKDNPFVVNIAAALGSFSPPILPIIGSSFIANAIASSAAIIRSKLPSSLYCIISSNNTGSNIFDIPLVSEMTFPSSSMST